MPTTFSMAVTLLSRLVRSLPDLRGRGAIAQRLYALRGMRWTGDWIVELRDGSVIDCPRSSGQSWVAAFTGHYDDALVRFSSRFVKERTTVLDIGACFGFWTIPLARRNPRVSVIAFEPVPQNRRFLLKNLELNHVSGAVKVLPVCLGSGSGETILTLESPAGGNAAVAVGARIPGTECVSARLVRLDDLDDAQVQSPCSFIKIDVEGFEMDVLAGGESFVERHRPVFLGEFSSWWFAERGWPLDAPLQWAQQHRYGVFDLQLLRPNRLRRANVLVTRRLELDASRSGEDLLLVPKERITEVEGPAGLVRPPRIDARTRKLHRS